MSGRDGAPRGRPWEGGRGGAKRDAERGGGRGAGVGRQRGAPVQPGGSRGGEEGSRTRPRLPASPSVGQSAGERGAGGRDSPSSGAPHSLPVGPYLLGFPEMRRNARGELHCLTCRRRKGGPDVGGTALPMLNPPSPRQERRPRACRLRPAEMQRMHSRGRHRSRGRGEMMLCQAPLPPPRVLPLPWQQPRGGPGRR